MLACSFNTDTRASLNTEINLSTTRQKPSIFQPQDRINQSFNHRTEAINLSTTGQKQSIFQPQDRRNNSFNPCNKSKHVLMLARPFNTDTSASLNREINLSTTGQKQSIFQPQDSRNNSFTNAEQKLMLARSFNTDTGPCKIG
jgi:hypothetical protein